MAALGRMTRDERLIGIVAGTETRVSPRWADSLATGAIQRRAGATVKVTYADRRTEIRSAHSFRKGRAGRTVRTTAPALMPEAARIHLDHNFND